MIICGRGAVLAPFLLQHVFFAVLASLLWLGNYLTDRGQLSTLSRLTAVSHFAPSPTATWPLEVCEYTRTRGFTRTRPVPAGRVGVSRVGSGTGKVITGTGVPGLTVRTFSFGVTLSPLLEAVNLTTI